MHRYRTHNCNELRPENVGETARLSGWIHRRRDHGQLVFLDLRDHFGITQCVVDIEDKSFSDVEKVREEVEESKKMFRKFNWPAIDVTRRSVEETAASIIKIYEIKKNK